MARTSLAATCNLEFEREKQTDREAAHRHSIPRPWQFFRSYRHTHMLAMETFADIITHGNSAALAGEPMVENWPQMRGAIYVLGHAIGGLDQAVFSQFEKQFPPDFEMLEQATRDALPSERTYHLARHQVSRLLALLGQLDNPWEQLRMQIRRAGRSHDIENAWYTLRRCAIDDDLAPRDIDTRWVWSLEAEAAGGLQRQSLRQGATAFNKLFGIPDIVAAGLLPPNPIGPPPAYDGLGRPLCPLPPTLAAYEAGAKSPTGLKQVWQAISMSGTLVLSEDPTADDILAPKIWEAVVALPQSITGVRASSWRQYLQRARRLLLRHQAAAMAISANGNSPG